MGRKTNSTPSFIESDGLFITKAFNIAKYLYGYFIVKVGKLRQEMPTTNDEPSYSCLKKQIMKEKHWKFEFCKVGVGEVEKLLLLNNGKPPGIDNLGGNLLRIVAGYITTSICHIFNLSLEKIVCPQAWREGKVIPLTKNGKAAFTGSISRSISLLPVLSKLLEKIVFPEMQCYFSVKKLTTDFWHAYREGHSTRTELTQTTDDWLK